MKIADYHAWIKEAYDEIDKAKSVTAWQRIFGEDFQQPASTTVTESALAKAAQTTQPMSLSRLPRAPREQYIEERGFSFSGQYMAEITATVTPGSGSRRTLPLDRSRRQEPADSLPRRPLMLPDRSTSTGRSGTVAQRRSEQMTFGARSSPATARTLRPRGADRVFGAALHRVLHSQGPSRRRYRSP